MLGKRAKPANHTSKAFIILLLDRWRCSYRLRARTGWRSRQETETDLQGLGPLLLGAGLRRNGGLAIHPLEHLRRHSSAGLAVDAAVICAKARV